MLRNRTLSFNLLITQWLSAPPISSTPPVEELDSWSVYLAEDAGQTFATRLVCFSGADEVGEEAVSAGDAGRQLAEPGVAGVDVYAFAIAGVEQAAALRPFPGVVRGEDRLFAYPRSSRSFLSHLFPGKLKGISPAKGVCPNRKKFPRKSFRFSWLWIR